MLDQLAGEHENIRLRVIADFSIESNRIPIECVPWTSHTEADELAHCHIGLAPLNDDAWTRGKCGCKVLQYMASGLPVVSSDMQAHRRLLGDDCGLFAVTATKWMTALSSLIESTEFPSSFLSRRSFLGCSELWSHWRTGASRHSAHRVSDLAALRMPGL